MSATGEALAEAICAALDLHLAGRPEIEGNTVEQGDYEWSTNGQLLGIVVNGERFTLSLQAVAEGGAG